VPGREEDEWHRSGLWPIEILRIREAVDLRHANVFGAPAIDHVAEVGEVAAAVILAGEAGGTFATSDAGCENDLLADVNGGDFRADLGDFAGHVATGNVRKRDGYTGKAAANPEVEMIEGASAHANQDFIVAESRFGDVGVMKDRRITVFIDDDGFHGQPPWERGNERGQ
jgi:hypothetical protein